MNNITPKEAIEILSHYTDLGYGIVIEGEDTSKIKQALSLASKTLANGTPITEGDLIMFRTLMTEIANKGLPFEEVLLLIDNAPPVDLWQMRQEATENALKKAEVLYGRPKGKWINEHYDGGFWYHTCNKCNSELEVTSTENFCRNCGADMRTKENESV